MSRLTNSNESSSHTGEGVLHGIINRDSDVKETNKKGSYLITGVDEISAIDRILAAYAAYKNDLKKMNMPGWYKPIPTPPTNVME
ncbi:MAG: hypothetical protein LBQ93_08905 [Treponema sp.]|nr:hypothetical protein [Treponema sp.]